MARCVGPEVGIAGLARRVEIVELVLNVIRKKPGVE
jgi:hypothetical protein